MGLRCPNGHLFPYSPGAKVPVFASESVDANEYALENAANIHDNSLRWVFDTFETDEASLRKSLVSRLHLSKGETILVTGAGAGNDLPYLAQGLQGPQPQPASTANPRTAFSQSRHREAVF